ncbi:MAG: riboflavin biosynthesis protein RibF [Bacteroidales bacterium]|nr:riboflavin biosynthesis protein RibF [Bacteroidales bacterium]
MKIFTNINENITKNCFISVGFFDGVHLGHSYIISQLQEYANRAGTEEMLVTLWPHPKHYFGNNIKLLTTLEEKIEILRELKLKNLLILEFNRDICGKSGMEFIQDIILGQLNAGAIIMGYNNSFGRKDQNSNTYPADIEIIKLKEFTLTGNKKISSSIIRKLLEQGLVDQANELLGYEFILSGIIEHGYKIGRKLGFPTANLGGIDKDKLIPANGVYIAEVEINDDWYPAMLNIGTRPTFNGTEKTIEFHVLNYNGDMYDERVTVKFVKKIREERKFDDADKLISQLHQDREITQKYFGIT